MNGKAKRVISIILRAWSCEVQSRDTEGLAVKSFSGGRRGMQQTEKLVYHESAECWLV